MYVNVVGIVAMRSEQEIRGKLREMETRLEILADKIKNNPNPDPEMIKHAGNFISALSMGYWCLGEEQAPRKIDFGTGVGFEKTD